MQGSWLTEMLVELLLMNKFLKLLEFSIQGLYSCLFSFFSPSSLFFLSSCVLVG